MRAIPMSKILPLKDMPLYGVFVLVNTARNSVYIKSSRDCLSEYSRLIALLKRNDHECKELNEAYNNNTLELLVLRSLDKPPSIVEAKFLYNEVLAELLNAGYIDMREGYVPIRYKLKKRVLSSFTIKHYRPLVYVYAESVNKKQIVLGIFTHVIDADKWIADTFPNPDNIQLVIHDGELTQLFRSLHGESLLKNDALYRIRSVEELETSGQRDTLK